MLDYVVNLTKEAWNIVKADDKSLRNVGFSDEGILDIYMLPATMLTLTALQIDWALSWNLTATKISHSKDSKLNGTKVEQFINMYGSIFM